MATSVEHLYQTIPERHITVTGLCVAANIEGNDMSRADGTTLAMKTDEEAAIPTEKPQVMVGIDGKVCRPTTTASILFLDVPQWISVKNVQDSLVAVGHFPGLSP